MPKHKGISYFICPMDTQGIEIRPITTMTGVPSFNEVFTDVRIPAANLVGDVNDLAGAWPRSRSATSAVAVERWRAVGRRPDRFDLLEAALRVP